MHILGKVLVWLSVVLVVVASWLTTTALSVRHRWLTAVETRQKAVEKQIQDIADTRIRIRDLEEKRQTLVHNWGDVWAAPNSRPQPGGQGAIELGVGTSSNLPQRGADGLEPSIYVFSHEGEKTSFLGEFAVIDTRPTQAIARLTRRPYPQETGNWALGLYHVRGTLPANWLTATAEIQGQQIVADSRVAELQIQKTNLEVMTKASQVLLDQRLKELNGDPAAPADASDDVKDGLVKTVQKAEASRDTVLSDVSQFRRKVIETYDLVIKTLGENLKMVQKLEELSKQQSAVPPVPVTTQSVTTDRS